MRIYFLHTGLLTFVNRDLEILRSAHEVRSEFNRGRAIRNLWKNIKGIIWSDLVYCWFASINHLPSVFIARLLNKKLVVVVGGHEVASLPELDYGNMRGGPRSFIVRLILRLAHRIITVSRSSYRESIENAHVDPSKTAMIYHGFPPVNEPTMPKGKIVVTVGNVMWNNLKRKGLEDFVRVAKYFPEVPFKLVGRFLDDSHLYLEKNAPVNVELTGFVDDSVLADILSRATVYVQASGHEGFGCSVAEAMLHKCIPVVNNVYSLPEVVGNCGLLVSVDNEDELRMQIKRALGAGDEAGERARKYILDTFPVNKRKAALLDLLNNV